MVSMIVAQARNRVIGSANDLPWYLPADLKRFKDLTSGHSVIMGRKTYASIIKRLGKPLPNRLNIVVSRDPAFRPEGVVVAASPADALQQAGDGEVFVIGGASIYEAMLDASDRIYQTQIDAEIPGDAYFPALDQNQWHEVAREQHASDERNPHDYAFVTLERQLR
jgi:dihydrofolate reductase